MAVYCSVLWVSVGALPQVVLIGHFQADSERNLGFWKYLENRTFLKMKIEVHSRMLCGKRFQINPIQAGGGVKITPPEVFAE